jgi:predicted lipoprotein with Yx(FWY)xxD motif
VRFRFALVTAAIALIAPLTGCGSSKSTTATTSGAASSATPAANPYSHSTPAATSTGSSASATPGSVVTIATKRAKGKLGTILAAGPKQRTVYLFEADSGKVSSCTGACAKAWPPVTSTGAAIAGGSAKGAEIGTITRPDGTKQVTYGGHPLYFFERDGDSSDAYGQGVKAFGAGWYALAPSGKKVDTT